MYYNISCSLLRLAAVAEIGQNIIIISKNIIWMNPTAEDEDSQDEDEADAGADTSRVEEIPPKEPLFNAVPLKSALKKRPAASPAATPLATPLAPRQDHHHASFKSVYCVQLDAC